MTWIRTSSPGCAEEAASGTVWSGRREGEAPGTLLPPPPSVFLSRALPCSEPGSQTSCARASCEPCQLGLGPPFGICLPFHKHRPGVFLGEAPLLTAQGLYLEAFAPV